MPSLMDNIMTAYDGLGFTTGSINDRMFAYLRSKGGTGSLDDMQYGLRTDKDVTVVMDPSEVP